MEQSNVTPLLHRLLTRSASQQRTQLTSLFNESELDVLIAFGKQHLDFRRNVAPTTAIAPARSRGEIFFFPRSNCN